MIAGVLALVVPLLAAMLLATAARIGTRVMRLPVLINSLDYGKVMEVDFDRWFVVSYIESSLAGIHLYGVKVTPAHLLKGCYFFVIGCAFLLTDEVAGEAAGST